MLTYYWLIVVGLFGLVVGSFLNVAVARLPLEKSLIWPGSRCGNCFQAIRWYDNIPLLSYFLLRGKCRSCGARYSVQYMLVELSTGLGFAALFYAEVVVNIHGWPVGAAQWQIDRGIFPLHFWAGFIFHAILFSLLMTASVCDLKRREIPLEVTITGTVIGLAGSAFLPWPWPWTIEQILPANPPAFWWLNPGNHLAEGTYAWPLWLPLPFGLEPGSWQLGLATGLAGAFVGTFMLRAIRFLFSAGLGKEALGLGDADLMMMAGAFLGWQIVVVSFFISVFPALVFRAVQMIMQPDELLPFGPSLAAGTLITSLCWRWIGPQMQPLFFWGQLLLILSVGGGFFFFISAIMARKFRDILGLGEG